MKHLTEETKLKISESLKGKKKTLEHSINISLGKKGMVFSKEHKNKISKSLTGRNISEQAKTKIKNDMLNRAKYIFHPKGENSSNWKGGITPLNKRLRTSSMWKIWREAIFLRDNFTCQNIDCSYCHNKIGVMLHPHHIKAFAKYPELRFDINNGVTYCKEFHMVLHKISKLNLKSQIVKKDNYYKEV